MVICYSGHKKLVHKGMSAGIINWAENLTVLHTNPECCFHGFRIHREDCASCYSELYQASFPASENRVDYSKAACDIWVAKSTYLLQPVICHSHVYGDSKHRCQHLTPSYGFQSNCIQMFTYRNIYYFVINTLLFSSSFWSLCMPVGYIMH